MFMAADEFPLPYEYQHLPLEAVIARAARRPERAHGRVPRLRQHRPDAGRLPPARGTAHPEHRPPPRQHALRHREPRGCRRPPAPPRSSSTWPRSSASRSPPRSRRPLYIGLVTDTGKFMYENTTPRAHRMAAELIEAGRRAGGRVTGKLYEDLPFARLQLLARALQQRAALRRRRAHAHPPLRARTSTRPAPARPTPRGSSTTCARSRAPPWRRSCPRARRRRTACARSACARPTAAWTSRRSRASSAAAATARPRRGLRDGSAARRADRRELREPVRAPGCANSVALARWARA